ncbi:MULTISPECIES: PLDc N-terminal domain-containing protein [unclassified Microbacterium]|uniref:PLDc N-terminal domain-containing protein n=1 Tax=unclassified Microbacterium TaxID=2609290 RepID=UPI00214B014F|nr:MULTISPECIES: PLDc N-terminal domain-containing protein [unclassified Microbacterium]MCR2810819.1 PLDc N-terminal domain-containing protein [Microbacterium sp. zg.B185]WIM19775.1 PLDc N-terminal domain-containing protein [Microbacterium sp. zg-B185]
MPRVLLILALVATAFWVYTIVDCSVQPATRHRGVSKPIWILIVVLLPVLGGLLWLTVGRVRRSSVAARRAPDDDPEFLEKIGTLSDQDERIRRLEEELALLDAEDDDPRWRTPDGPATAAGSPAAGTPGSGSPASDAPKRATDRPADGDEDPRGQRGAVG